MPKVKSSNPLEIQGIDDETFKVLEEGYYEKLDTDKKYSLEVDPFGKYKLSETHREFIANYARFQNIPIAAKITGIDEETALDYFNSYATKVELRRINLALYHRAFATKMLNLDEVGGYLTSIIIGENIADAEKITTKDKLSAAKMILDIHKMKQEGLNNPDNIIDIDVSAQLKDLSAETLKAMLDTSERQRQAKIEEEQKPFVEVKKFNSEQRDEAKEYYDKMEEQAEQESSEEAVEDDYEELNDLSQEELLAMLEEASVNEPSILDQKLAELKKKKASEKNEVEIGKEDVEEEDEELTGEDND